MTHCLVHAELRRALLLWPGLPEQNEGWLSVAGLQENECDHIVTSSIAALIKCVKIQGALMAAIFEV